MPTADIRNGDFSDSALTKTYDPITGDTSDCLPGGNAKLCGTGRTQFPGNVIPIGRLNPVALKLLSYVPLPNNNLNVQGTRRYQNNFLTSSGFVQNTPDVDATIDHYLTQNDHLSSRFSFEDPTLSQPGIFGVAGCDWVPGRTNQAKGDSA
ncbi:MAG: hypothetical protein M3Y57_05410 [Acidobacteriota bacterium]|nr:hypothetical protein [Acidobacteriota bacterium]